MPFPPAMTRTRSPLGSNQTPWVKKALQAGEHTGVKIRSMRSASQTMDSQTIGGAMMLRLVLLLLVPQLGLILLVPGTAVLAPSIKMPQHYQLQPLVKLVSMLLIVI